jgi:molecular chaperone DnaK
VKDEESKTIRKLETGKNILLRSPCTAVSDFIERYASCVDQEVFVLPRPNMYPVGTSVCLEVRLKDNKPVFKATGEIAEPSPGRTGTVLRVTAMDPVSRGLFRRMLERSQTHDQPLSSVSVDRQSIVQMLRNIELVSEDTDETCEAPSQVGTPKGIVLGIDLGTTNTCCAIVKDGKPFIIPSRRGHQTIPSVVAIDPMGQTVVGSAAKAQMEINPKNTVYGSKRLVGRPYESPIVQQVRDRFHYEIVPGRDGHAAVNIESQILSLEKVSSLILNEIRDVAQEYLGKVIMRAVITVPAYYNENQRSAVRAAGQLAGLHVERILNEPTAAALAYGVRHKGEQRLLVYDLGGGTFDVSVLHVQGNVYEVLATGGDTFLGGVDFDTQLMDHIVIEFQLQLGKLPQMERIALLRALQGAEFAKCALSARSEYEVRLPFIGTVEGKPVDLQVKVTREQFENLVKPMVKRTLDVCDEVLIKAGLARKEIDAILLVGGQTRMPMIWSMIEEHFGKQPIKGVHPDESVAVGAALMADSMDSIDALVLVDVLPMTIGVGVPGGSFTNLIEAGTRVPIARTFEMRTFAENQTEIHLPVYQGESLKVDENEYLGTVHVRGIPPGPPGSRTIDVTFRLSSECLLTVTASDRQAGELAEVIMTTQDTPDSLRKKLGLGDSGVHDLDEPDMQFDGAPPSDSGQDTDITQPEVAVPPAASASVPDACPSGGEDVWSTDSSPGLESIFPTPPPMSARPKRQADECQAPAADQVSLPPKTGKFHGFVSFLKRLFSRSSG